MAATRPAPDTHSVAFVCGSSAWNDGFLAQGRKWARALQTAAGGNPNVQVGDMSKAIGPTATVIDGFSKAGASVKTPEDKLDATFAGLRGHTLVLLTHGLESHDPSLTQEQKDNSQGLLFYNQVRGESPLDMVITKQHLDFMEVNGSGDVVTAAKVETILEKFDDGKPDKDAIKFKADTREYVKVVNAIRNSIYERLVFAACGGGRRLEKFAARMKDLTAKSIFFNDDTISFPTPPTAPFAEVGPIVGGVTNPLRDGFNFMKPEAPENKIPLRSQANTFLPGTMRRLL